MGGSFALTAKKTEEKYPEDRAGSIPPGTVFLCPKRCFELEYLKSL